jgi:hypothetical protein
VVEWESLPTLTPSAWHQACYVIDLVCGKLDQMAGE